MRGTTEFSEYNEVLGTLAPLAANAAVGDHETGYFDLAQFHRAFIWVHIGEAGQGATIDITVNEATDLDGTGEQELTTKAPDQIVAGDQGGYVGIELRPEELTVYDDYHCVNVEVTVGTATYYYGLVAFGCIPRFVPADVTGYTELVD
jgi:hypothetical protein